MTEETIMENSATVVEDKQIFNRPKFGDWLELFAYPILGFGSALAITLVLALVILVPVMLLGMESLNISGITDPTAFTNSLLSSGNVQAIFLAFFAIVEIAMTAPVFFLGFTLKRFSWESFGLKKITVSWKIILESLVVVVLVNGLEYFIRFLESQLKFKLPEFNSQSLDILIPKSNSFWLYLVFLISIGIIGPICEELIFRGAIYGWFRRYYKPWIGILVSSLFFGLLHYETLTRMIFAISIGAYLAWMYERDKTLTSPIILHIMNNSIVVTMMFFFPNL
jgi:membrane protease YdiL (CAAX protease family)